MIVSGFVFTCVTAFLRSVQFKVFIRLSRGKNEIVFWNPFTGPDGKNMKAMVDAYNKTNPKYKVKNISLAEGDMYAKIPTVVNSKRNIPDLNIVHAERIKQFVDKDMLVPMDNYLSNYPDIKAENYIKAGWDIGSLNNKRYSVPLDVHSFVMYYNKDLVKNMLQTLWMTTS